MPSGQGARRLLLLAGIGIFALLIVGLAIGAIGSSFVDKSGYIPRPEVNLAPEPVFPASTRNEQLALNRFTIRVPALEAGEEDRIRAALEEVAPIADFLQVSEEGVTREIEVTLAGDVQFEEVEHDILVALARPEFQGVKAEAHEFEPLGVFEFAVTNTMLSSWVTTVILVLLFWFGARKARLVPGRLQNLLEMIVEALLRFVESVAGRELARRFFPIIATIFLFVLLNAWMELVPIYQSLGFKGGDGDIRVDLLRTAGSDLNMPLALALISFIFVEYWGLRRRGLGYLGKFFSLGNLLRLRFINLFVGFLEMVSEFVRIVSFTFRLFGNMTAGKILIVIVTFLVPFVATDFVYGLELLVGLVQALIFAGLTLVFVSVAVAHESH